MNLCKDLDRTGAAQFHIKNDIFCNLLIGVWSS